jgi:hypothetical protein
LLFESFLYPYFEKNTLFAVGNYLLGDLYNYLADCCHKIKQKLKYYDHRIPLYKTIFCWNKVQTQNEELLLHLKEQFNLESVDSCEIEKKDGSNDTITVKTTTAPIILRYDREKEKVLAMSRFSGGEYKDVEYGTVKLGSDILVGMHLPDEEILGDIIFDAKKQIQQIIYEFVYDLSLSASNPERAKEFSYYYEILSQDQKFMATVEDIYKNRHGGFEKGYHMLNNNV